MKIVIIIPCLNEEKTIGKVIDDIPRDLEDITELEVLVVDDGSTDDTVKTAKEHNASVVSHSGNMGVGKAFQTGLNTALKMGADIIVNIDGDGQFNPNDIPKLIQPIIEDKADFVTASRFIKKGFTPKMSSIKKWGNRRIAGIISILTGKKFYDVSCGFRAYSKETALRLNLFGKFTYTQETFLDLAFKDIRMMEVPLKIRGIREYGKSRVASNLWKYAVNSSKIIFRTFRDYKPLRFFGFISVILLIISLGLGGFFLGHYIINKRFSPHLWAGLTAGFLFFISVLFFVTGLLADMLDRIRQNQEKILYYEKLKLIEKEKEGNEIK